MGVQRNLGALLFAAIAAPTLAAPPWAIEDERRLSEIVPTCSGGEYGDGETRNAQMIGASLPKAGEDVTTLDVKRASDVYLYAGALLKPSIVNPERALDPGSFVKCPPDPALGVKLMAFLAGDQPGQNASPTNLYYWLGMAYRRGVGVPADQLRARQYFLQAQMLGLPKLTAEDWGASPNDQLLTIVRRPENRRWLEAAAAAGKPFAMLLLAELIVEQEPARAQSLLAAQPDNIRAARKLAEYEMVGRFGAARPDQAVRVMAHFQRLNQSDYDLMLQAARQYNAIGEEIPVSPRQATLNEIGGSKLLVAGQKQDLDSIRGVVRARALVDPAGTILYIDIPDPQISQFRMAVATLNVFAPPQLSKVVPLMRDGRPIYHWLNLPPIRWASPPGTSNIRISVEDLQ